MRQVRFRYALSIAVVAAMLLGSTAPARAGAVRESVAQTRDVVQRFVADYNDHDLVAVLALVIPHVRYVDCNYATGQTQNIQGKRAFSRWLRHQFAQNDQLHPTSILAGGVTNDTPNPRVFGIMGTRTNAAITARGLASESIDGSKGLVNNAGTKIRFYLLATC